LGARKSGPGGGFTSTPRAGALRPGAQACRESGRGSPAQGRGEDPLLLPEEIPEALADARSKPVKEFTSHFSESQQIKNNGTVKYTL